MLRLVFLGAVALASNSESVAQPIAPDSTSKTRAELAIEFKLTTPFKTYDEIKYGDMTPELKRQIEEIFIMQIDGRWTKEYNPRYFRYDFVNKARDEKWFKMMKKYTDVTTLNLKKFYKKAVSPKLINFFANYCGTRMLSLPTIDGDLFADFGDVEIPKIRYLWFDMAHYNVFPSAVLNFTGLIDLSINDKTPKTPGVVPKRHHLCPDVKSEKVFPKLCRLEVKGLEVEKISRKFLEALKPDTYLVLECPSFSDQGGDSNGCRDLGMRVRWFLANADRDYFTTDPLCDGSCLRLVNDDDTKQ